MWQRMKRVFSMCGAQAPDSASLFIAQALEPHNEADFSEIEAERDTEKRRLWYLKHGCMNIRYDFACRTSAYPAVNPLSRMTTAITIASDVVSPGMRIAAGIVKGGSTVATQTRWFC